MRNKITLFIFGFLIFGFINVSGQCVSYSLDLGPDTVLCAGDSLTLQAGTDFLGYLWNNGSTDSNLTVGITGSYVCAAQVLDTTNLVVNGDFTQGNSGFTSNYVYGTGGTWGLLSNPGQFAISTNANLTHTNFANCTDHTTGTGNYMIMNGASTANTAVWCQTVNISPSTTYVFSAWFTSVVASNPANLEFMINGVVIGNNFILSSTTCNWQNYYQTWTSGPSQTTANICIVNQNIAGGGNDFGMDDIYFAQLCESVDTIQVTFNSIPDVDLGNDTVICPGNNLVLDVTDSSTYTYLWSNGSTNPVQSIGGTDSNLWVQVSNGGCIGADTLIVTNSASPQIDLGPDSIMCPGDTLVLDAVWPQAVYTWQDNSTDSSFNVLNSGTYWVEVTDNCGTNSDTVLVDYVIFPLVDLGPDSVLCKGDTLSLDISIPNGSYVWSNNSTSPLFDITLTGTYSVAVTKNYCTDYDTIQTTFNPSPNLNLGPDTTLCQGESIILSAANPNSTYSWQDGSVNSIYFVSQPNTYWVEVTRQNCKKSDTIVIDFIPLPNPNLGNDTSLCTGETLLLNAGNPNSSYAWQDSSTDSTFLVTQAGAYWVDVTNTCGTVSETLNVVYNTIPSVNIGADTTICEGDEITLNAKISGSATYVWNDNSTKSTLVVSEAGTYAVSVTLKKCTGIDQIEITSIPEPNVDLGPDGTICAEKPLVLDVTNSGATYLWQDGSTDPKYVVSSSGLYFVAVSKGDCIGEDSVLIEVIDCAVVVQMPNIFTPNGDGENDLFVPILMTGAQSVDCLMFNRWGAEVFQTSGVQVEWDGKNSSGVDSPDGVYYWVIKAQGADFNTYEFQGTVTLAR